MDNAQALFNMAAMATLDERERQNWLGRLTKGLHFTHAKWVVDHLPSACPMCKGVEFQLGRTQCICLGCEIEYDLPLPCPKELVGKRIKGL